VTAEVFRLSFPEKKHEERLIKMIFHSGAFNPTPRTFSSGIEGPCFVDLSIPMEDPMFLELVKQGFDEVLETQNLHYDAFCGVIRGGAPLAEMLGGYLNVPSIARLGFKEDQERLKMVRGRLPIKCDVIIVDDVETTGRNAFVTYKELEGEGHNLKHVLYVMSYGLNFSRELLGRYGLISYNLFTINDLVTVGLRDKFISREDAVRINNWQEELNSKSSPLIDKPN